MKEEARVGERVMQMRRDNMMNKPEKRRGKEGEGQRR